ncbi:MULTISPECIES: right-handed parallel beta-helix repeat-containing protein [unclassified Lentimicrobium]|uniref:right-handed parallel beta-helix repeat-containing protein n=1 Tax=unclassified Lentimicrobium TaxID=2677434 RepID=UPI001557A854|nr:MULTISPECIES: right-handed parallel beta-helix repeat-containing protein [unclassified Lentimicrobium]NPD45082.1 hypothetical protein [Lentimicrobium sp. S6]NPD86116.1 hypothetical protein [Lentimicrobium sp. L6]
MKYTILISVFLFLFVRINAEEIVFTKHESPYLITEDLIINSSDTLLILHGATLIIDQDINIIINGTLQVNGSKEEPVSFLPQVPEIGWGKIELNKSGGHSSIRYAEITDGYIKSNGCQLSLKNVNFYNEQNLTWEISLVWVLNAGADIRDCVFRNNGKGEGIQVSNSNSVFIKNCNFFNTPDAIELIKVNGGRIVSNYMSEGPDDGIDLNNCIDTQIDSNIIVSYVDRGMELGSENFGSSEGIVLRHNLIVDCNVGVILKENSNCYIKNNTFYGNDIAIRCIENNDLAKNTRAEVVNCIISQSRNMDVFSDELSTLTIDYTLSDRILHQGQNNIFDDPMFLDTVDFRISTESPCVNAGDPNLGSDPDDSICDIGAYWSGDVNFLNPSVFSKDYIIFPNPFMEYFIIKDVYHNLERVNIGLFDMEGISIPYKLVDMESGSIRIHPYYFTGSVLICKIDDGDKVLTNILLRTK